MLSTLLGWRLGGVREDSEPRVPGLTRAKGVLLGGAAFNTLASAIIGASTAASRVVATPVRSDTRPSRKTPPEAALAMRVLRFTGHGSLVLLAATVVVISLIEAAEPKPHGLLSHLLSD